MNSRTLMFIVLMGLFGVVAFVIMAMIGVQKLSEKPLVRAALEVAERHKVREVSISLVPPTGPARTLRVGYETFAMLTQDDRKAEMEAVAKSAWEKVKAAELNETLRLKREGMPAPDWGPVNKVQVRRTWRNERGCFKRSDESSHEWTPPPTPPTPPVRR
jgi:hypothetical protein